MLTSKSWRTCAHGVVLAILAGIISACDHEATMPVVPGLTAQQNTEQDQPFYYYEGSRVNLDLVPQFLVVSSLTTDPKQAATEVLASIGVTAQKTTRLSQAPGHWLFELPSGISTGASEALSARLKADARFEFVSNAFKIQGGSRVMLPVNRVGVEFRNGTSRKSIDSLISALGARIVREPRPDSGFKEFWIAYPRGPQSAPLEVAAAFATSNLVQWAHPDMINDVGPNFVPSDGLYSSQYYLKNSVILNGVAVDINVEQAWDAEPTKGCGVPSAGCHTVAIIDDGVEAGHSDFAGHVDFGYDVFGNNNPGCTGCANNPSSDPSHGTRVAGIIIAQHNGSGVAGIAPGAFVVPVRIFRPLTEGGPATDLQIADGINFAWYWASADVLNNSWAYVDPAYPGNDAVTTAVNNAATQGRSGLGAIVIFSAGNNSDRRNNVINPVAYPARLANAIAVGAIDRNGDIANYSPQGAEIALVAPSSHDVSSSDCLSVLDVVTTDLRGGRGCNNSPDGNDDYTSRFGGTSAAAPQVAGVATLLLAKESSLSRSTVRSRLTQAANAWGNTLQFGSGKLNAYRTLVPPTPPSVSISGPASVRSGSTCIWTANVSGGTPPYSYSWSTGGGYVPGGSEFTYTNTGTNFTIYLAVSDAANTSNSASKDVTISSSAPTCLF